MTTQTLDPIPTTQLELYQTFDDWQSAWDNLKRIDNAMPWAIGDLYNYGTDKFGEMASQVLDAAITEGHFTKGSIAQYAFVSRQWPISSRLNLPWSYHQTVASLPMTERLTLLQHCQENNIHRAELRQMVRELNGGDNHNPPTNGNDTNHLLQMENHEKEKRIEELEQQVKELRQSVIIPEAQGPLTYGGIVPDISDLSEWEQDQIKAIGDVAKNNGWAAVTIYEDGRYLVTPKEREQ